MNTDWLTLIDFRVSDDDLTYCNGNGCHQKESCLRWFKNYKGNSPYLSMVQTLREDGKCEYFRMA